MVQMDIIMDDYENDTSSCDCGGGIDSIVCNSSETQYNVVYYSTMAFFIAGLLTSAIFTLVQIVICKFHPRFRHDDKDKRMYVVMQESDTATNTTAVEQEPVDEVLHQEIVPEVTTTTADTLRCVSYRAISPVYDQIGDGVVLVQGYQESAGGEIEMIANDAYGGNTSTTTGLSTIAEGQGEEGTGGEIEMISNDAYHGNTNTATGVSTSAAGQGIGGEIEMIANDAYHGNTSTATAGVTSGSSANVYCVTTYTHTGGVSTGVMSEGGEGTGGEIEMLANDAYHGSTSAGGQGAGGIANVYCVTTHTGVSMNEGGQGEEGTGVEIGMFVNDAYPGFTHTADRC